jgi:hypothetical protein
MNNQQPTAVIKELKSILALEEKILKRYEFIHKSVNSDESAKLVENQKRAVEMLREGVGE